MLLEHKRVKQEIPWKMSHGILNLTTTSRVQGRQILAIRQVGGGSISCIKVSRGCWSMLDATRNCSAKSGEGILSMFPHPWGRPAC